MNNYSLYTLIRPRFLLITYTIPTVKNLLFAINLSVAIGTGYNRKLTNLAKISINNAKYISCNNSFIFKLTIFQDICLKANVLF